MPKLNGLNVAVLMTDGVEESELMEPVEALRNEGAAVTLVSPKGGQVQVMRHDEKTQKVDTQIKTSEANPMTFDAAVLPGGTMNGDQLRMDEEARRFVRNMDEAGKPIAAICHAPWLLVSAGMVSGRRLTSYHTLQDDIRNAGGDWVDMETVVDGNLLTSRSPRDLPAFKEKMVEMFASVAQAR